MKIPSACELRKDKIATKNNRDKQLKFNQVCLLKNNNNKRLMMPSKNMNYKISQKSKYVLVIIELNEGFMGYSYYFVRSF